MNIDLDNLDQARDRRKIDRTVSLIILAACLFDLVADILVVVLVVMALR